METLCLACCFIGTGLLILSVILCQHNIVASDFNNWRNSSVFRLHASIFKTLLKAGECSAHTAYRLILKHHSEAPY